MKRGNGDMKQNANYYSVINVTPLKKRGHGLPGLLAAAARHGQLQ